MDERKYVEAVAQDPARRQEDHARKVAAVRQLLVEKDWAAIVLSYSHNFAWLTGGGRNFINMAADVGVGSLYVDARQVVLLTNEIEGHRLIHEELDGLDIKLHEDPWYAQPRALEVATKLAADLAAVPKIVVDVFDPDAETHVGLLRATLSPYEQELYRALGADCGRIIGAVARGVRPSLTEWDIASDLSARCWREGITPVVVLIAADERCDAIRHPLPTNKRIKNKVMIVLCGRRAGLVLSVTRMVYVTTSPGTSIPAELLRRHEAATYVDATAIAFSQPGARASEIFQAIQAAYSTRGFQDEWKLHHQGGCAGYKSREWIANPGLGSAVVTLNQGFAWNPSITGTKSEDTVLLTATPDGTIRHEVISETPEWPIIEHNVGGCVIRRPGILHIAY